jgi:acyl dehydratase
MAVNYGLNKVRFVSPVHVGKKVRARRKLLSVEEIAPNTVQQIHESTIEIEGEAKPAAVIEMISRFYL